MICIYFIFRYIINATNLHGSTIINLNLTIDSHPSEYECVNSGKSFIYLFVEVEMKTGQVNFTLLDPYGKIYAEINQDSWENYKEYSYSYCVDNGIYNLTTYSGDYSNYPRLFITASVNGIKTAKIGVGDRNKQYALLNCDYIHHVDSLWYYNDEYEENWNNQIITKWNNYSLNNIPKTDKSTVYLKIIDNYKDLTDYDGYAIRIGYKSGIVIYINGSEIYRDNLQSGEIKSESEAIKCYKEPNYYTFILPIDNFTQELLIIGIELHKYKDEDNFPIIYYFDSTLYGIDDKECLLLNIYINPIKNYSKELQKSDFYRPENAFDRLGTRWEQIWPYPPISGITSWLKIEFYNTFLYFNKLSFDSYFKPSASKSIIFNGKEYKEYDQTYFIDNIPFSSSSHQYVKLPYFFKHISSLLINITSKYEYSEARNELSLTDIGLHLCTTFYCNEYYTLPKLPSGESATLPCRDGGEGERVLTCPMGRHPHLTERSTCHDIPELIYQEYEYTFLYNQVYSNFRLFSLSGNQLNITMSEKLPAMSLLSSTGTFNGKPDKPFGPKNITFYAKNQWHPEGIEFYMILTVDTTYPVLVEKYLVHLSAGKRFNDIHPFIVYGSNLYIMITNLMEGVYLDDETLTVYGMTFFDESVETNFIISNKYGSINFNITFWSEAPIHPNITEYTSTEYLNYGEYYKIKPVICVGKNISFSISPELSEGLKFNEKSGEIYGNIKGYYPFTQTYIISCNNTFGSANAVTRLIIDKKIKIISHVNIVEIIPGVQHDNLKLCIVEGPVTSYKLTKKLPNGLVLNKNGTISGMALNLFDKYVITMVIGGFYRELTFNFTISSYFLPYPIIINSTLQENVELTIGEDFSVVLCKVIGDHITYGVTPSI